MRTLKPLGSIRVLLAINGLLLIFFFGKAYWLETQIEAVKEEAKEFAQEHDLFPLQRIGPSHLDSSRLNEIQWQNELLQEYIERLAPALALESKRMDYLHYGQMCFIGFPLIYIFGRLN